MASYLHYTAVVFKSYIFKFLILSLRICFSCNDRASRAVSKAVKISIEFQFNWLTGVKRSELLFFKYLRKNTVLDIHTGALAKTFRPKLATELPAAAAFRPFEQACMATSFFSPTEDNGTGLLKDGIEGFPCMHCWPESFWREVIEHERGTVGHYDTGSDGN